MKRIIIIIMTLILINYSFVLSKDSIYYINNNKFISVIKHYSVSLDDIKGTNPILVSSKTGKTSSNDYVIWDTDGGLIIRSQRDSNGEFDYKIPLPENKIFKLINNSIVSITINFTVLDQNANPYASNMIVRIGNDSDYQRFDNGWHCKFPHTFVIFYYGFDTNSGTGPEGVYLLGKEETSKVIDVDKWFSGLETTKYQGENIRVDSLIIIIGAGGVTTNPYSKIKITRFIVNVITPSKYRILGKSLLL